MNSRFITPPSIVDKENHTVLLIDADQTQIATLHSFLANSFKNFDVYLYEGSYGDLEYLSGVTQQNIDYVLINSTSHVSLSGVENQSKFGPTTNYPEPLDYFLKIEQEVVDIVE